ncbi:MAG: FKBP-type peptidyl-prolyl cis-trans isomerase [Coriobacteriales bacterium]|nr:FKBP-type peptidyl-prolyl cis-trans isomerase [Coriobacteriales bacterium]
MKAPGKHRFTHYVGILVVLTLLVLLAVSSAGCKKDPASQVAATVNGTEILESDITTRIESFRLDPNTGERLDDTAWAQTLKGANYTPESLREFIIRNEFGSWILVVQRAAEAGITPDAAQVDQDIESAKESVTGSGSTWEDYLASMGFASEASYRQMVEAQSVISELLSVEVDSAPSQEEIETYVSEQAAQYAGKRVSLIYLPYDAPAAATEEGSETTEETATGTNTVDVVRPQAEEALAKLREGTDFAEVAKEYSQAYGVEENGGDLGWGAMSSLPENVRTALDSLPVNEVSDVIDANIGTEEAPSYALVIVKWTEEFILPEQPAATEEASEGETVEGETAESEATEGETAEEPSEPAADSGVQTVEFSAVPASLVEILTERYTSERQSTSQQEYLSALISSEEIVVNPMPEGLSYDVDMALADEPAEDSTTDETPADEGQLETTDTLEGTGAEAKTGDTVEVHYTGYLEDGTIFDSSVGGTPYSVVIGESNVIQGWHLGLPGMKVGGKRTLVIPPSLAYGEAGNPPSIPANATLTFELELVSVNGDSTGYSSGDTVTPAEEGTEGEEGAESSGQ